jgi:hypothetical protein
MVMVTVEMASSGLACNKDYSLLQAPQSWSHRWHVTLQAKTPIIPGSAAGITT